MLALWAILQLSFMLTGKKAGKIFTARVSARLPKTWSIDCKPLKYQDVPLCPALSHIGISLALSWME
jgi:hypothetical protein